MDTASAGGERTRFELIERLGKGGAGCVWRARLWGRHGITRIVALKVVEAGDEAVLRRMRDEARLLGLLQHRALVQVQDLVELEGGRWGMVMELLEGVDLQGLTAMGPVPFGVLLDVVAEVADALDCALKARDLEGRPLALTHRDVKPANLLMCADGRIKLLDFGVARANISTRESVTLQGELWGTLGYMSPERLHGEDTPAVDIYALGVVLYELALRQRFGRASLVLDEHEDRLTEARRRLELAQAPQGFIELTMSMLDSHAAALRCAAPLVGARASLRCARADAALGPSGDHPDRAHGALGAGQPGGRWPRAPRAGDPGARRADRSSLSPQPRHLGRAIRRGARRAEADHVHRTSGGGYRAARGGGVGSCAGV